MKATFFLTVAAVLIASVSAQAGPGQQQSDHHHGGQRPAVIQEAGGIGLEGRVSGILNNLLKAGLLADDSEGYGVNQDAF
ncbi:uncharacterized protein BYT42DRAFT_618680 [Radiomyces spectabilis]|uniref:uncharacterized protein n=1 Tax=Radiomyces spectabilis TaxID=64574 RepID=UPI00221ED7CD|nr:uncharacterized protein BYT42DRAFT_618680 [Radiomyces spectabilis]KAI8365300.1 hypothetical protein BYT42DRAFT_618680 [Radiomyces spectabilis]